METNIGKKCPVCGEKIKEGETLRLSSDKSEAYHEECWEKRVCSDNNDNSTSEITNEVHPQNIKNDKTDKDNVCEKCGNVLEANHEFCSNCGTRKAPKENNVCSKCGNIILEGQLFCQKCGNKIDLVNNNQTNDRINKYNANINQNKKKKMLIGPMSRFSTS